MPRPAGAGGERNPDDQKTNPRRQAATAAPVHRGARRPRVGDAALVPSSARADAARRRPPGAAASGIHGGRGDDGRAQALPAEPRLRSGDLGLRAQRRLSQQVRQRARAENTLHALQERPEGEPRGLEPGRRVRHVRRACGAGVRPLGDYARQSRVDRSRGKPVAAARQGALSPDRAPDGGDGAANGPAREEAPRAEGAARADLLPLLPVGRRRAAAGSDDRRQSGLPREHPRAGQPHGSGDQPVRALDRRGPPRAARGRVAAVRAAAGAPRAPVPGDDFPALADLVRRLAGAPEVALFFARARAR